MLKHFNHESDTPPAEKSISNWLVRGMRAAGEVPAVVFGEAACTHAELDAWSNRIAHYLIGRGVRNGQHVGLCLDRSPELVAALVGILKAGAAYVPLDPAYPAERLAIMQADAALDFLVVHGRHANIFQECAGNLLVWEDSAAEIDAAPADPVDVAVDPEAVAYVIFTSGSTGRPKGISMPHRALANLIEWQLERDSFRAGARVLQYSSISFDVSFQEIATTLASGGTLYLIADEDRKDPRSLLAALIDGNVERLFLPFVALRSLVQAAHARNMYPVALAEIITAGEQLRVDDAVRRFFAGIGNATLDNQYGPSETHVVTAHLLEGAPLAWPDLPPIGTPLKNCGTCILDGDMQPVPEGATGELYLSGRNLALGYVGRDDLTAEVFIPNPFDVPGRPLLYKTGDLAAYNTDGSINFLGRCDQQIKIRGYRIEPGEINVAAASHPHVGNCLTYAFPGPEGMLQLVSYYTSAAEVTAVDASGLRQHLAARLPEYMVPSFLVRMKKLPVTPSGKVDLKALPKPSIKDTRFAGESTRFQSATEEQLAGIWSGLLDLEGIPRSADFFELGGDSLRAVSLFLKISREFGCDLPLASLAQASTVESLARLIDGAADGLDLEGYRSLQMIQRGSDNVAPLFMIHGGMGNVLVFNRFARALGAAQPVYAFQWPGWDGMAGEQTVEAMAHAYCDELLRFHKQGPVRIGGYCIGGLIAIELARLLGAAGIKVLDPLVVCDTPNLHAASYRRDEPWDSAQSIADFKRMVDELNALRISPAEAIEVNYQPPSGKAALIRKIPGAMPLLRKAKALEEYRRERPEMRIVHKALHAKEPVPMELRADFCRRALVKAAKAHRSRRYEGDILYFRSDCVVGRFFALSGWWSDPFLGFAELCSGKFEAFAAGGNHTAVMDQPELAETVLQSMKVEKP